MYSKPNLIHYCITGKVLAIFGAELNFGISYFGGCCPLGYNYIHSLYSINLVIFAQLMLYQYRQIVYVHAHLYLQVCVSIRVHTPSYVCTRHLCVFVWVCMCMCECTC